MNFRIGNGIDVHQFKDGDHVVIGGVEIPAKKGILAHSDGDVLLHAICDAMLGALALGDIGIHFPPSDNRYKDISSLVLLEKCRQMIESKGYAVGNLDCNIVAEYPKIAPHSAAMREKISGALGIGIDDVSIKATTSEHMGFTGREEGILATATVLLVCKE